MKVVIDIPEEYYNLLKSFDNKKCSMDMLLIRQGTPLPKGHGRLIDADELINDFKLSRAMSVDERLKAACIINHAYDKKCLVEADEEGGR